MKQLLNIAVMTCLVCALILAMGAPAANANSGSDYEKEYCDATLEDAFTEDDIAVWIFPDWHDKVYTVEDFAEIDCISVRVVMASSGHTGLVQMLHLKIADGTKQKVLDAIKVLEAREDIQAAEPNYLITPDTGDTVLIPSTVILLLSGAGLAILTCRRKKNFA